MSRKVECPECQCVFFAEPPKNPGFRPPTVEDVTQYCKTRGNKVDPQRFVDFYESKGWVVGKSKMKSWEASVRTWERDGKTLDTMGGPVCPLCKAYRMPPNARVCNACGAHCRRCSEQTANLTVVKRKDGTLSALCKRCLDQVRGGA